MNDAQSQLANNIVSPNLHHKDILNRITGSLPSVRLVQIYRNNFVSRFTEALLVTFPKINAFLGENYFNELAKNFITHVRFDESSLLNFGANFPSFIAQTPTLKKFPYLENLAQLEWAIEVEYNQAKTNGPKATAKLTVNQNLQIIKSEVALLRLWQFDGQQKLDLYTDPQWVLLHHKGYEVLLREVTPQTGAYIQDLMGATTAEQGLVIGALDQKQIQQLTHLGVLNKGCHE